MTGGTDGPGSLDSSPGRDRPDATVIQYELGETAVVVARGEFDMNTSDPLTDVLHAAAREHSRVVLDAAGVTFADSLLLTLLLRVHRQTSLRVAAPSPQLRRVLELTGSDKVLDVRATVEDALVG
ncbi:STAS domain-containing protein [Streptomyces gilvus]|uniref:STAS domain-containing protein n=1 Tax=Streptomyces gilvus TaxID=2920937 RepID=UPI001F0CFF1D|nr:STAS domain-containing protein [Streptomyces sp. CME 23]MCH5674443.1 STAS domain-containing protein [Streptomyces sp. CME 23]